MCVYACIWLAHLLELLLLLFLLFLLFWFSSSLCLDIFTVGPHCVSCIKGLNPAYWVREYSTLAAACQTSQHVITATINRHRDTDTHSGSYSAPEMYSHTFACYGILLAAFYSQRVSRQKRFVFRYCCCFFFPVQRGDWWLRHRAIKHGRHELVYATTTELYSTPID